MKVFTYVSVSCLGPESAETEVKRIVESSRQWNTAREVGGSLIYSGDHFAQIVEGPPQQIDELVERLSADPRHTGITILRQSSILRRQYATWSMGFSGHASFVNSHLKRLQRGSFSTSDVERLEYMLWQFAGPQRTGDAEDVTT